MAVIVIPRSLEDRIGKEASDALAGVLKNLIDEEKKDMLARVDEKVTARQGDILRRIHEDVAGVELRLSQQMADFKVSVNHWLFIYAGFMVVLAWFSKHYL